MGTRGLGVRYGGMGAKIGGHVTNRGAGHTLAQVGTARVGKDAGAK